MRYAIPPILPLKNKNGSAGIPGISAKRKVAPDTVPSARGLENNCVRICISIPSPLALLVTTIPAAVAINNAGICDTRPSPIVKIV